MDGIGNWEQPEVTSEQRLDQELAWRWDLKDAIGIIVSPPHNRVEPDGSIVWGKLSSGLIGDPGVEADLRAALESYADTFLNSNPALPETDRKAPMHRYEIPPAAQSWPDIAVMLWEHGRPILDNVDLILGVSLGIKEIVVRTRKWFEKKNEEIAELNRPDYETGLEPTHDFVQPSFFLTQGAIVALVVADLVSRFGYSDDLRIDSFPRGIEGYNDPAHPNSMITYLIRCRAQGRVFAYVIASSGDVTEHFELQGGEILPLPAPDILSVQECGFQSMPGENGVHLEIGHHGEEDLA